MLGEIKISISVASSGNFFKTTFSICEGDYFVKKNICVSRKKENLLIVIGISNNGDKSEISWTQLCYRKYFKYISGLEESLL